MSRRLCRFLLVAVAFFFAVLLVDTLSFDENAVNAAEESNGWEKKDENYFYKENGEYVKNRVMKIGSSWYAFDLGGRMYEGESFSMQNNLDLTYVDYRAKEGGALYVNEWYIGDDFTVYYGADGAAPSGLIVIEGETYLLNRGIPRVYDYVKKNGIYYLTDKRGVIVSEAQSGWNKVDDVCFYLMENGEMAEDRVLQIDGKYYGFDYAPGRMFDNIEFHSYFGVKGETNKGIFRAKKGGELYVNEWFSEEGRKYYYGEYGRKIINGIQEIEGVKYYFGSNGVLWLNTLDIEIDGRYYMTDERGVLSEMKEGWNTSGGEKSYIRDGKIIQDGVVNIDGDLYAFDSCIMVDNNDTYFNGYYDRWDNPIEGDYYRAKPGGKLYVNEWYVDKNKNRFYYGTDGKAQRGLMTIEGVSYLFDESGSGLVVQNKAVTQDGISYVSDSEGNLYKLMNGWNQVENNWFFVKYGTAITGTVKRIGGAYYGFDQYGCMYDDVVFAYGEKEICIDLDCGEYVYEDCYWKAEKGGKARKLSDEWINGVYYNSEGIMGTSGGTWKKNVRGWWYQYKRYSKVKYIKGSWARIDEKWYCFDQNGYMLAGEYWDGYWLNKSGEWTYSYRASWKKNSKGWSYGDSSGWYARSCWLKIDGKWYYFSSNGCMVTGTVTIQGKKYHFDQHGVWIN